MVNALSSLSLAATSIAYGSLFHVYERRAIPNYNQHIKTWSKRCFRDSILVLHIFAGLAEVFRWHIQALHGNNPQSDVLDLILCLAQSGTNLYLVKRLRRGIPGMTRMFELIPVLLVRSINFG